MSTADTADIGREPELERERDAADRRHSDWIDSDREPEAIERELDATRADLRATLTALERRLSFDRLVELTVGRIREHGGQFAGNLGHAATQSPVPLLLTSVGLGWMMLESRRTHSAHAVEPSSMQRMGDKMHGMGDKMHAAMDSSRDTVARARDSLTGAAESVREGASNAASATRERVEHARQSFDELLEEQPLLLGAIGLAAGALIGALLPASETEDRWLGDARDKALQGAARATRERASEHEGDQSHASTDDDEYSGRGAGRSSDNGASTQPPSRPH